MSETKTKTVTVTVAADCKVAAHGVHIYHLKKGENQVPANHAESLKAVIAANKLGKTIETNPTK